MRLSVRKEVMEMKFKTKNLEMSISPKFVAAIGRLIVALHLAGII